MVQSPSWEANWFAASQEIPRISRDPKVHYRTHKRPPPVPILGQPNLVHIPTSHLLEIHPNIIHPSTPRSPQWSPSLRFPHQGPIHPPLLTQANSVNAQYCAFHWLAYLLTYSMVQSPAYRNIINWIQWHLVGQLWNLIHDARTHECKIQDTPLSRCFETYL